MSITVLSTIFQAALAKTVEAGRPVARTQEEGIREVLEVLKTQRGFRVAWCPALMPGLQIASADTGQEMPRGCFRVITMRRQQEISSKWYAMIPAGRTTIINHENMDSTQLGTFQVDLTAEAGQARFVEYIAHDIGCRLRPPAAEASTPATV